VGGQIVSLEKSWDNIGGPELIKIITARRPDTANRYLPEVVQRLCERARIAPSVVWLHETFSCEIAVSGFERIVGSVPFSWVACPKSLLWENHSITKLPIMYKIFHSYEALELDKLLRIWGSVRLEEHRDEFAGNDLKATAVLQLAYFIVRHADFSTWQLRPQLEGLDVLCRDNKQALYSLVDSKLELQRLGELCASGEDPTLVCKTVGKWYTLHEWVHDPMERLQDMLHSLPDETCREQLRAYLLDTLAKSWSNSKPAMGVHEYAKSLPGFTKNVCGIAKSGGFDRNVWARLVACGKIPKESLCAVWRQTKDPLLLQDWMRLYRDRADGLGIFLSDFIGADMIAEIEKMRDDESCRTRTVEFIFEVLGDAIRMKGYSETDVAYVKRTLPRFELFCFDYVKEVPAMKGDGRIAVSWLCPNVPESIPELSEAVERLSWSYLRYIVCRPGHVFEDSITLLTDKFISTDIPWAISRDGEGISREEWIGIAMNEGWPRLFDTVRLRTDRPIAEFEAFGRLMGLSIRFRKFSKHTYPSTFFEEFLEIEEEPPLLPVDLMTALRTGFTYVYELTKFKPMEAKNFRKLFT
jgi:hypothetical protein